MMELSHSLLLNEEALSQLPDPKKPVFVYEWLWFLNRVLPVAQKSDIKGCQSKLVEQLTNQILTCNSPATRKLLARCLATLFSVGDTYALFQSINTCNDLIRNKDDSPSYLPARLNATSCLGAMYEKLGRMVGRSFEETTQLLVKSLKNAESQGRVETMRTFQKMALGLGPAAGTVVRKDIYKSARVLLTDRSMSVRCAAAQCLEALTKEAHFLWAQELENVASACFKALESSNYEVRLAVAKLLGSVLAVLHNPKLTSKGHVTGGSDISSIVHVGGHQSTAKPFTLDECWAVLASGFLRGCLGFFRGGTGTAANIAIEIRTGLAMAYVEFITALGPLWLERNSMPIMSHLLDLAACSAKSGSTLSAHDIVHIRNCVCYVIRQTFGKMLNEQAQISTCKEIGLLIAEYMNSVDLSMDSSLTRSLTYEHTAGQQVLVCALIEMAYLVYYVGGAVSPLFVEASGIMEPVFAVLMHPCLSCRMASAWCLRCVASVVPSLLAPLMDRCLARLEHQKSSVDAISGYSLTLSTLLGIVYKSSLGIPQNKGKQIFAVAEELLRSASQSSRLTLVKTQSGWLLISSLMSLSTLTIKSHLPKLLLLWKNAFPRSAREAENERQRGDSFTWQVTLESRAGALAAMQYFLSYCKELVTDDVLRRILVPIETALVMLGYLPMVAKQCGSNIKNAINCLRCRLYKTLLQMNPKQYENLHSLLLRELVADFTLTDNPNVLSCTLYQQFCHQDSASLRNCYNDVHHNTIENRVIIEHPNCVQSLENDVFEFCNRDLTNNAPSILFPSVALIDVSISLFGSMFPYVPTKHRLQMLEHFNECIKQSKGLRQQVIQTNIIVALLCSLKAIADNKTTLENENVVKSVLSLILTPLNSPNAALRFCSAEALGRLTQVVVEPRFVSEMVQYCVEKLKSCRDEISRTGHSLALGCLHRYVGGLSTGQNLNISVGILLALAQDLSSSVVQVWSIYALSLIAASSGPMFRGYVEPILALCLKILLITYNADVCYVTAKLISAIIVTVGPELQSNVGGIVSTRNSFLTLASVMSEYDHPVIRAEATACLQQLHLFAPRHVNLSTLVPQICISMKSAHISLRKAAVACLRQLVQREAKEVCEHTSNLVPQGLMDKKVSVLPESGIEGALFTLLDYETDPILISNVKETLTSLIQFTLNDQLTQWLTLCKDILVAAPSDVLSPSQEEKVIRLTGSAAGGDSSASDPSSADDQREEETMKVGSDDDDGQKMAARHLGRTFAVEIVRRIIVLCANERAHFDLALAKELQLSGGRNDYLVLHLSDLVRMSFMAATSNNVELRLAGLSCLQDVITSFARVSEPEFPGHLILEQFQAQVGAALRPAFTPETPSHVTAAACQVCSTWIGSGVARDLNDLRRVHQLLTFSLEKLNKGSISTQLYNESASTLEKLAILKAWAEVYIVAVRQNNDFNKHCNQSSANVNAEDNQDQSGGAGFSPESLLKLVTPELSSLITGWLNALRDYALLMLPNEFSSQLPAEGGSYFSTDSADIVRVYYRNSWSPILLATATWLTINDFDIPAADSLQNFEQNPIKLPLGRLKTTNEQKFDRFLLILGACMEALCSHRFSENTETVNLCLESLNAVLKNRWVQSQLINDYQLIIEMLNVLHRLILTRENLRTQILCMEVVNGLISSCELSMTESLEQTDQENESTPDSLFRGNEGGDEGKFVPGKSVAYAALEVCLCQLVRQIPTVNPATTKSKVPHILSQKLYSRLSSGDVQHLVINAMRCLVRLPSFCSKQGSLVILPTLLYLTINVLRDLSKAEALACFEQQNRSTPLSTSTLSSSAASTASPVVTALHCLRSLISKPVYSNGEDGDKQNLDKNWVRVVQSSLWSVLALAEQNNDELKVDESTILLAVAIFLVSVPGEITCAPNLLASCINLFKSGLSANSTSTVQLKCLQSLQSIFAVKEAQVAVPFIRELTPLIVRKFKRCIRLDDKNHDHCISLVDDDDPEENADLSVLIEAERSLEVVVAASDQDKRLPLVSLIVQLLMSFVVITRSTDGQQQQQQQHHVTQSARQLHDYALQRLNKFGPAYPDEFKILLARLPHVKTKLELAVRQQNQNQMQQQTAKLQSARKSVSSTSGAQPAIKLTMDFSAFKV